MHKNLLMKLNIIFDKNSPESEHEGNLNIIKAIYDNPELKSFSTVKNESISSKIRNKTRISTPPTFIQHSYGSPSHSNQRRQVNKMNPNWKRSKTITVCR